jgi:DNA processing protein
MALSSRQALLALNLLPKIGPVRVRRLLDYFGSPEDILKAPKDALLRVSGVGPETAGIIAAWESQVDLAREEKRILEMGLTVLLREDPCYPEALREIYDPPLLLYVRGEIRPEDARSIAVVGSRRCTHYGTQVTKKLSYQLAAAGVTIISGLARGIDTAAHEGALAAGGRTIAVIGSGLAKLYPPENESLAEKIANGHGAVISEFPIDLPPDKQTFPMRNRIVSGWSQGLLVVESPLWSGSLITANLALDQGRNLYAVPGPIDRPSSAGCHKLIQQGAKLVMEAKDILEDLGILVLDNAAGPPTPGQSLAVPAAKLSDEEKKVLASIETIDTPLNDILERCGLETAEVIANLMRLEIKGHIKQLPGRNYARLT